jgi:hypothetical protein
MNHIEIDNGSLTCWVPYVYFRGKKFTAPCSEIQLIYFSLLKDVFEEMENERKNGQ